MPLGSGYRMSWLCSYGSAWARPQITRARASNPIKALLGRRLPPPTPRLRCVSLLRVETDPGGSVIARAVLGSDRTIHAGIPQSRSDRGAKQEMIEAKAGVALPAMAQIVPEGVDALFGMQ